MVPLGNIVNKGLTIRANQAAVKRHVPKLIEHVKEGRLNPKGIITHRVPLEDIADAYHIFSAKLDNCIKPCCCPMAEDNKMTDNVRRSPRQGRSIPPAYSAGAWMPSGERPHLPLARPIKGQGLTQLAAPDAAGERRRDPAVDRAYSHARRCSARPRRRAG
jgi:hypothetical protein